MKFNKWTVALAALGVVSLASAAKAEEKASPVMTALAATTISGYVDTSAQWNFGTGNANNPPYKFGGATKADGFNLDVIQLRIDKPLDEQDWAAGYRADLWFGPDANTLGTQSILGNSGGPSDFAIRQAYVALRAPVGSGLDFKMGVFDSVVGYESIEAGNNPNFTRSYGHSIEPQTHTGVLASYRFCDAFSASFGVADTVSSSINGRAKTESYKAYMGSIALTAPESMGFLSGSTLYAGIVNGFSSGSKGFDANGLPTQVNSGNNSGNRINYYVGATLATPVTGLRLGAAFDYLKIWDASAETWSIAGYASFQATEKLSFHARAEYLDDSIPVLRSNSLDPTDPTIVNSAASLEKALALTATVQYDLWKNVISRLELRWDHSLSGQNAFGGSTENQPSRDNAWMLAANVIYKF